MVRAQGYAVDDGEQELGVRCVAVAVNPDDGGLGLRAGQPGDPRGRAVARPVLQRQRAGSPAGRSRRDSAAQFFHFVERGAGLLPTVQPSTRRIMRTRFRVTEDDAESRKRGSAMDTPEGIEVTGPIHDRFEEILSPRGAGADRAAAPRAGRAPRGAAGPARRAVPASSPRAAPSTSSRRPAAIREDDSWRVAEPAPGPGGPPGRDDRADRPQDDDQRAQLRRQGVAGRPGGRQHPAVGERRQRPAQPARLADRQPRLHQPRGQGVPAQDRRRRRPARDRRPPARLAPAREAHPGRRPAARRRARRLRALPDRVRAEADRPRPRARTSTWRRWSPTSRRGSGTTRSTSPRTSSASRAARSGRRC